MTCHIELQRSKKQPLKYLAICVALRRPGTLPPPPPFLLPLSLSFPRCHSEVQTASKLVRGRLRKGRGRLVCNVALGKINKGEVSPGANCTGLPGSAEPALGCAFGRAAAVAPPRTRANDQRSHQGRPSPKREKEQVVRRRHSKR